jgi:hypothetical protein
MAVLPPVYALNAVLRPAALHATRDRGGLRLSRPSPWFKWLSVLPAAVLAETELRPTIGQVDYPSLLVWIAASRSVFHNASPDAVHPNGTRFSPRWASNCSSPVLARTATGQGCSHLAYSVGDKAVVRVASTDEPVTIPWLSNRPKIRIGQFRPVASHL